MKYIVLPYSTDKVLTVSKQQCQLGINVIHNQSTLYLFSYLTPNYEKSTLQSLLWLEFLLASYSCRSVTTRERLLWGFECMHGKWVLPLELVLCNPTIRVIPPEAKWGKAYSCFMQRLIQCIPFLTWTGVMSCCIKNAMTIAGSLELKNHTSYPHLIKKNHWRWFLRDQETLLQHLCR